MILIKSTNDNSVDRNLFLQNSAGTPQIKSEHQQWFLNQALLLTLSQGTNPSTRRKIELAVLHGYSKISTISSRCIQALNIQSNPLIKEEFGYYRCTSNPLLCSINGSISIFIGLKKTEAQLVCSPLISEVFAREYPQPELDLKITSKNYFTSLVRKLLKEGTQERVILNITPLIGKASDLPKVVEELKEVVSSTKDEIEDLEEILSKLHLVAFIKLKKHHIMIIPHFLKEKDRDAFLEEVDTIMGRTGFRVSPDQAKDAWLSVSDLPTILSERGVPMVSLGTHGGEIPHMFDTFSDFMKQRIIQKFLALANGNDLPPYLKVFPKATVQLLDGIRLSGNVDHFFNEKGLQDLLQASYFRMINAMQEAILRKDVIISFHNQLEIIHNEIQWILSVFSPHSKKAFAESTIDYLKKVLPKNLRSPLVHLKPSGMHCLSSVVSSVEALKGTNRLTVAIIKDSYYHEMDSFGAAKTFEVSVLDEESEALKGPIDLFVTEFHHNILHSKQIYKPVNVLKQVKSLIEGQLVSEKLTVVVDNTIDLQQSASVQEFLADSLILDKISNGSLNVIFLRSAQKFDMLGMDNYYGGITVSINNPDSFQLFNERMNQPDDQLQGLSYQGLTHIQRYAAKSSDLFRKSIMKNLQLLYQKLPENAIFSENSTNPMQISKISDDKLFFLDIKFPNHPKISNAFKRALVQFTKVHNLPFAVRASFGFAFTTFTVIDGDKLRLNVGMEDEATLDLYAEFFNQFQSIIEESKTESLIIKNITDRMLLDN